MRTLQAHKYFWHRDGASNYVLELSRLLSEATAEAEVRAGDTVIPFAMAELESLPTPYSKFFVSSIDLAAPGKASLAHKLRGLGRMFYSIEARDKMAALLEQEPVDIVHLHNIYHHISPSILPVIKARGIPVVMTLHDYKLICPNYTMYHHGAVHEEDGRGWYWSCVKNKCFKNSRAQSAVVTAEMIWHHKIMKYFERYVDRFIAPSEFMYKKCIEFGIPAERLVHIPHPQTVSAVDDQNDGQYVTYVGRLSEEKGLLVLLDAAAHTPEIQYRIVGTGPLETKLRTRIDMLRHHNVELIGFKTGAALEEIYRAARIIVVPSTWYENYSLSILEAKARGKVVIGSDIGGIPELLPPELLVPAGDAVALAEKINFWFNASAAERQKVGERLCEEVKVVNDPARHVRAIRALYNGLVK